MELQSRARSYTQIVDHLFGKRGIRGKLKTAKRGARHLALGIRLADPLRLDDALKLANPIALATNTPAVIANRRADAPGLVSYQFELQHGFWQTYTRADVSGLGVGLGESRRQIDFSFEDAPHCLVAGSTKCGKSVTVGSILTGLCEVYTPDDLKLVMIDPDHDYDAFDNVAHLAMPIASEPDQVDRALSWVGQQLAERKERNAKDLHRLLVVVDEAEDVLEDEGRLAIVQAIARGGRKWRVNLLVATQKPKQANLPDLINQLGNRFIGKCDSAQMSVLLSGHAGLQAHKLSSGGGDFLHVNGSIERFQVAQAVNFDKLPRAETYWPEIDESMPTLCVDSLRSERSEGGRPAIEIDGRALGYYIHYGPDAISMKQAEELLGLKRRAHEKHKALAEVVVRIINYLKSEDAK